MKPTRLPDGTSIPPKRDYSQLRDPFVWLALATIAIVAISAHYIP